VAATQAAEGGTAADDDAMPRANVLLCYVIGRWHQFAKSGFKRLPSAGFEKQAPLLI
jgi:TetR/AcrR family transcriptional regulator